MVQRRRSLGLLDKAGAAVAISQTCFGQQFDGDETFQAFVPGLVDPTRPMPPSPIFSSREKCPSSLLSISFYSNPQPASRLLVLAISPSDI